MRSILLASVLVFSFSALPLAAQSSNAVRAAQEALKSKGFDPGPIDGIVGPRTRAATRDYQKQQNLSADGRLGPKTLDSLQVKNDTASGNMHAAGSTLKSSYAGGGTDIGHSSKDLATDVAHGHPVEGAKDFGKGVGHGVEKIGAGTGHAAKDAAKSVKDAVKDH
jgi:peptidoglycan hydrolase-like protein with peptidoglycan-binding domain